MTIHEQSVGHHGGFSRMRKKKLFWIAIGILIYILLIMILWRSEVSFVKKETTASTETTASADNPDGSKVSADTQEEMPSNLIDSPGKAIWYSLVTLTTVGYGDFYPMSPVGRLIGLILMLLSVGLVAFIISAFLHGARTRLYPRMLLRLDRRQDIYLFDGYQSDSKAIAWNLKKDHPEYMTIFCNTPHEDAGRVREGIRVIFTMEEVLRLKGRKGNNLLFYVSGNGVENYERAAEMAAAGYTVCCMSEYEPSKIPKGLILFDPYHCCARLYWKQYPVISKSESSVLIGSGRYAEALLEHALITNVISPDQHMSYIVYGGAADFENLHPYLLDVFRMNQVDSGRDSIVFRDVPWSKDLDILKDVDRIIICEDDEERALETFGSLQKYCPFTGTMYIRIAGEYEKAIAFGDRTEIFTTENVLHQKLSRAGRILNDIFRKNYPDAGIPEWDELSEFLQRSNLASADHLDVKIRILLGEGACGTADDDSGESGVQSVREESGAKGIHDEPGTESAHDRAEAEFERGKRAYEVYLATREEKADFYRWIEHERWMRFLCMYNWRYGEERDDAKRLHPFMVPYEKLSKADQEKDDNAWLLLKDFEQQSRQGTICDQ